MDLFSTHIKLNPWFIGGDLFKHLLIQFSSDWTEKYSKSFWLWSQLKKEKTPPANYILEFYSETVPRLLLQPPAESGGGYTVQSVS